MVEQAHKGQTDDFEEMLCFALMYYGPQAETWEIDTFAYRTGIAIKMYSRGTFKGL